MEIIKIVVEAYQKTLCQVDIILRYDETEWVCSENEDNHCHESAYEHRLWITLGRIVHLLDVDTGHFHTSIEKEDTWSKDEVVQFGKVRPETAAQVHLNLAAGCPIEDTEDDKKSSRDDSTDETADFRHLANPTETFQRDESSKPINNEHHDESVDLIVGQCHIACRVHADEGKRHCTEGKNSRIPDGVLEPLKPDGEKT